MRHYRLTNAGPFISGVRRKFSWGVSFSGIRWLLVFGMGCL